MSSGARILFFAVVFILAVELWLSWPRHGAGGPRYGAVPIYRGTPFKSIYLGANDAHAQVLYNAITTFAETNGIRRCKGYMAYSGPPLADYTGDDIAIFVRVRLTKDFAALKEKGIAGGRGADYSHWPTNGSRIVSDDHSIQMPYTMLVWVSPFGTNYSLAEFTRISDGLISSLRSAFRDQTVDVFASDSETR